MISLYILDTRCLETGGSGQTAVALNRPLGNPALGQAVALVQESAVRVCRLCEALEISSPHEAPKRELITLATLAQKLGFAQRVLTRAGSPDPASTIRIPQVSAPA